MANKSTEEWVSIQNPLKEQQEQDLHLIPCTELVPVYSLYQNFHAVWNYNGLLESILYYEKHMQQRFESEIFKFKLDSHVMDGIWYLQIFKSAGGPMKIRAILELAKGAPIVDFLATPTVESDSSQFNFLSLSSKFAKVPDSGITSYLRLQRPRNGNPSYVCRNFEMEWLINDDLMQSFVKETPGSSSIRISFHVSASHHQ